jgi:hypothetical protein
MRLTTNALLTDKELPVKVEAAIGLQMFLSSQDEAPKYVESQIKEITKELLTIIRETENEDLTNVMQKIVCTFTEQLLPVATEICQHLATTFSQVLESEEGSDEKAITAMGLLNTIETLLSVMEEHPDVLLNLHPIVINVVGHIFQHNITGRWQDNPNPNPALHLLRRCMSCRDACCVVRCTVRMAPCRLRMARSVTLL